MAVPTGVVQATPAAPKYDAFKHRSFIYDEEDDEGFDALSPGLLAMGYTPAVRKRAPTVESEEEFQPTLPAATASDLQSAVDEEDGDEEQEDAAGEEEGEGEDEGDESSESAETYDSEDEEGDGGEGEETGETGNEEGEQGEETTPEGEVEGGDSAVTGEGAAVDRASSPAPLYKLPGGSKHREPRAHHAPKSLPHTNSGTTMEAPTFKVTTNSRYQKGGGSWIKNDSPGGTMLGALSNTPAKGHHQPKQIIPTSDSKQPLARRHSSMINQCKFRLCM
jgi:hypothetical protein